MARKLRVPPSGRDFEAYERVTVEQQSTRVVAGMLGISQTRICQIVKRVKQFVLEVTPPCLSSEDVGRQCNLAKQVAAARMEFLYGKAVRDYERTAGEQTVIREVVAEGRPKTTITTTKFGCGDLKCLDRAAKYAMLAAKLPVPNLAALLPDEEDAADDDIADDDTAEGETAASLPEAGTTQDSPDDEIVTAEVVEDPAEEACSPADDEQEFEADDDDCDDDCDDDESDEEDESSDYLTPAEEAEFRAEVRAHFTVQARQKLLKMGFPEGEVEELLKSPYGERMIWECQAGAGA